jgi:hypothetical protein
LAELILELLGSKSKIEFVPYQEAYAPGFEDMLRRRPRIDKLEKTIGFHPTQLLPSIVRKWPPSRTNHPFGPHSREPRENRNSGHPAKPPEKDQGQNKSKGHPCGCPWPV